MRETQGRYPTNDNSKIIEVDVFLLIKSLWKKAWLIIIVTLLCGIGAYVGTKFLITPTYQASFTAYVNNKNTTESSTSVSNSDLSAAQSLVYTYANILTSRSVLTSAAEQVGQDYAYADMVQWVSVEAVDDTEIIKVSVEMENPEEALALATAIENILPEYVTKIVDGSSVEIIDDPVLPDEIYKPNYTRNAQIGCVIGFLAVIIILILREILNDTIQDENELEKRLDVVIIGTIPDLASKAGSKYGYGYGYGYQKKPTEKSGRRVR